LSAEALVQAGGKNKGKYPAGKIPNHIKIKPFAFSINGLLQ